MISSISVETWAVLQIGIDLCLIILFILFVRQGRSANGRSWWGKVQQGTAPLESVLKDAQKVASQFDVQLKEKQQIVKRLNEHLDSRIISLNLLVNRAEICLSSGKKAIQTGGKLQDVYDLQQDIMKLSEKGLGSEKIAKRLGISKGEVSLVLDLKRKFLEMEQT